jgi:hypothetical protein
MLGAAVAMLALVGAFVAFGSWPGHKAGTEVDQVLLNEVVKAKPTAVAVHADAVKTAKRETRKQVLLARRQKSNRSGGTRLRDGTPVANAPTGRTAPTGDGRTTPTAPGTPNSPASDVQQQAQNVTKNLETTTKNVGTQVQQQVDTVQQQVDQTTTQVNEVVDQVVGGVQQTTDTTVGQVGGTVDTTVGTVQTTVGGLLGK